MPPPTTGVCVGTWHWHWGFRRSRGAASRARCCLCVGWPRWAGCCGPAGRFARRIRRRRLPCGSRRWRRDRRRAGRPARIGPRRSRLAWPVVSAAIAWVAVRSTASVCQQMAGGSPSMVKASPVPSAASLFLPGSTSLRSQTREFRPFALRRLCKMRGERRVMGKERSWESGF